ncbi:DgyrCDS7772 [Dimorphilus gyrociliatus]|uniref:Centriolar satellite-associated tubulin polyglutamylase complex regulator 1 n=1 Tax=Dimorphilus gyrociliatus TaxID=2664684 RepID=A0A7I8VS35_9ANNE|nr:DgyrCDS7772 [Dimorphilus gyrociliatus]
MTPQQYLEKHFINVYLEDAVTQLLEHKDETQKVNVYNFMADYFQSVKNGKHTLFRSYSYVSATPHNRASMVQTFGSWLRRVATNGELLSIAEYHSLLKLICPDFPLSIVKKAARIVLMDDATDCSMSFTDFLYAFQLQFVYDEFLTTTKDIFLGFHDKGRRNSTGSITSRPVVVPTSETEKSEEDTKPQESTSLNLPIDSSSFLSTLLSVVEKYMNDNTFSVERIPPISVLEKILKNSEKITYYEFLLALTKSDDLNKSIGRLLPRMEFAKIHNLAGTETEVVR